MIVKVRKKSSSSKILKLIIIAGLFFGIVYISLLIKEEKLLSIELEKAREDEKIALQVEQEKKEKEKLDAQRVILIEVEKVVDLIARIRTAGTRPTATTKSAWIALISLVETASIRIWITSTATCTSIRCGRTARVVFTLITRVSCITH